MRAFDRSAELDTCARLLLRIQQGDERAFRQLYEDFSSTLMLLFLRFLPDRADAERALHEVFRDVWIHAQAFDPDLSRGGPWLHQLGRRHLGGRTHGQVVPLASAD